MSFISYAQNFEDVLLWRALGHVQNGRYVDIGAQDPTIDSVSKAFQLAGWRGVHVEAMPDYAAALRRERPDDIVIQAAIGEHAGTMAFYEIPETGLSTGVAEIAELHRKQGYTVREQTVAVLPLDQLLEQIGPGEIHWMKIDVEGMEPTVLRSWHDHPARPWILLVESTVPNTQIATQDKWIDLVTSRGYQEVYFDGLSRYFVAEQHRDLDRAFALPPNVFDGFDVADHHFVARQLRATHEATTAALQSEAAAAIEAGEARSRTAAAVQMQLEATVADLQQGQQEAAKALDNALATSRELSDELDRVKVEHRLAEQALRRAASQSERQWKAKLRKQEDRAARSEAETAEALDRLDQRERQIAALVEESNELLGKLSSLQSRAARSDELIRKALAEPIGRWQRLGRAIGVAENDRARQVLQSWIAQDQPCSAHPAEPPMQNTVQEVDYYYRAGSLAELLAFDGADFVQVAYATILGREPDPTGAAHYLHRLGQGVTKIQIIDELSRSKEARLFPDPLPGLKQDLRNFRLNSLLRGRRAAGIDTETRVLKRSTASNVDQFMRYHDDEFVRVVYQYYLEREADEPGLNYYVRQIRSGVSRQQVLLDIARSPEARRLGNSIPGERGLAMALFIERIPVLGSVFAAVRFNLIIRQHLRDIRAMQNHLYRLTKI